MIVPHAPHVTVEPLIFYLVAGEVEGEHRLGPALYAGGEFPEGHDHIKRIQG